MDSNTLAPAPVTPAAPVPPVMANIHPAPELQTMNGKMGLVFLPDLYVKSVHSIIVTTPAPIIWKAAKLCWGLSSTLMALPVAGGL